MDSARTTERQTLLDCAAALSKDNLAPRAAAYDRDATYPKESWQDLWEAGLFGMLIPQEYGGLGFGHADLHLGVGNTGKGLRVQAP